MPSAGAGGAPDPQPSAPIPRATRVVDGTFPMTFPISLTSLTALKLLGQLPQRLPHPGKKGYLKTENERKEHGGNSRLVVNSKNKGQPVW